MFNEIIYTSSTLIENIIKILNKIYRKILFEFVPGQKQQMMNLISRHQVFDQHHKSCYNKIQFKNMSYLSWTNRGYGIGDRRERMS